MSTLSWTGSIGLGDGLTSLLFSIFPCSFMCLRSEDGCVYVLLQPSTLHMYGLSEVCTCECFLRSDEFANLLPHPANSQTNGLSPVCVRL